MKDMLKKSMDLLLFLTIPLAAFSKGRIQEAATDFVCIFGILGARLYYVLTSLDEFDSFYDAIAIF